jgi:hypothetical protein
MAIGLFLYKPLKHLPINKMIKKNNDKSAAPDSMQRFYGLYPA